MPDLFKKYKPHVRQVEVHKSRAKEKYLEVARRGGKSRGALGELLKAINTWYTLEMAGRREPGLIPLFHAWVVVPSDPQGRQTWHEMDAIIPKEFTNRILEDDRMIYLEPPQGVEGYGLIEMKSAYDPGSLQTVGLDFLWVNESQDVSERALEKLRPTLRSPGRMGLAVFEGIPALYPDHWFRKGCVQKIRTQGSQKAYFHWTCYDNPMLDENDLAEIEGDKELLSRAAWERMYLAKFSSSAGFFANIDSCIAGDLLLEPIPGTEYVGGIDFGLTNDATVFHIMDAARRKVVSHHYFDSVSWPMQKESIAQICEKWGLIRLQVDATGMQRAMAEELDSMGLPIEYDSMERPGLAITGDTRNWLIGRLRVALERGTVQFPDIPTLSRQLRAFQEVKTRTGLVKAQAPEGEHDDEVFALALALSVCEDPSPSVALQPLRSRGGLPTMNSEPIPGVGAMMLRQMISDRRKERLQRQGIVA